MAENNETGKNECAVLYSTNRDEGKRGRGEEGIEFDGGSRAFLELREVFYGSGKFSTARRRFLRLVEVLYGS
jgi:hypothetical protein